MQPLTPYEEKLLLRKISIGDEWAFKRIYDAYFNRLSAYIFKFCKSPSITEEIVQEVFVKAWIGRKALADADIPEAYLFSIARNRTIDYLRRLAKETDLIRVLAGRLPADSNELEHKWEVEEIRSLIAGAMAGLSAQKKKIFRLSKDEGLDHDEIAHVMQLSKSTVKNHLSETLRHIRRYINRQQGSETFLLVSALLLLFPF